VSAVSVLQGAGCIRFVEWTAEENAFRSAFKKIAFLEKLAHDGVESSLDVLDVAGAAHAVCNNREPWKKSIRRGCARLHPPPPLATTPRLRIKKIALAEKNKPKVKPLG
jgi:hypothetical protein